MTVRNDARSALVVGGGIAGLTAAIALSRRGWQVEVAEINADWSVAGWGLSLTGPSLRALDQLGLTDDCVALGYGVSQITNCDSAGQPANVIDLPRLAGPQRPSQVGLARPALHRLLHAAALADGARLRAGSTVTGLQEEEGGDGIRAELSDGSSRLVDLVVGADGIRSSVRALLGIIGGLRYGGQLVWRAIVPRPAWATTLLTFAGPEHNAGVIPISARQAYVFVTENGAVAAALPPAELASRMRELLGAFSGRVAEVRDTIRDPADVVRRPVQTTIIDGPWHRGRAVLIGDAAHAPSPQMVSGAALAIEDATVLAEELDRGDKTEAALAAFGRRRLDRCRFLVQTSIQIAALEQQGRHAELNRLQQDCHRRMAETA